jgi:hypothetical protein
MFSAVGIGPGYPGIRNYLIKNGVYSDLCKKSNITNSCSEQENRLDNIANLSLTLLNGTTIIGGILVDILGNKITGIIGLFLWIIAMSVSGINPHQGIYWEAGFIIYNISSIMIFFPTIFLYIPSIFKNNPSVIPCALAIITGIWDLGAMTLALLSDIVESFDVEPSITIVFLTYGFVVGSFSIIFILYNFGCKENKINKDENNNVEDVKYNSITQQFRSTCYYLKNSLYWCYVFNTILVVTYGYFFISQLTLYLKFKDATDDEVELINHSFSYLLAGLGFISTLIMGILLLNENDNKLSYLIYLELITAILMSIGVFIKINIYYQILTFIFFIIWRITAFTFVNSTFSLVFENNPGYGKAIGILYSISGIIGTLVGNLMDNYVQNDINNFSKINLVFTVLNILSPITLLYIINKKSTNLNNVDYYNRIDN